ncbi:MAG: oligosaccharide flippase family protein [Gemmatimonas sp.]|uniref:oligosaccharide flippase family protein n=1 Tax=Gemmatimonas sp. TaxID=1962908 RepID=UPI00391F534C|nr:oligosaccharide flippase family protein [Gemmatimonadota bacterium]
MAIAPGRRPARELLRSTVIRALSQALSWVSTLIVARVLMPSDYGIATAAAIYIGLLGWMAELGISAIITTHRNLSDRQIAQIGGLLLYVAIGVQLLATVFAPLVAYVVKVPEVAGILPVLGVATAASTLAAQPLGRLQRDLQLSSIAGIELTRAMFGTAAVLAMALAGLGYWALVLGQTASTLLFTVLLYARAGVRPTRPTRETVHLLASTSSILLASRLAWYFHSNVDSFFIARMLGSSALGVFSFARNLTLTPFDRVSQILLSSGASLFSSAQEDDHRVRHYYLTMIEVLALLLLPMTLGLGFVAPELVGVLVGSKWKEAAPLVQLMSVGMVARVFGPISGQLLIARLRPGLELRANLATAVILPLLLLVGLRWGLIGVVAVWSATYPLSALFTASLACRSIGIPLRAPLGRLVRPLLCALGMLGVLFWLSTTGWARALPAPMRLALWISVGVASYAVGATIAMRPLLERLLKTLRAR